MDEWIEVARVGKYKEGDLSASFLSEVVKNYNTSYFTAPITLNHKEDGETFGRIAEIKLIGDSLFAKFSDVRDELIEMIRNKTYTERSAEFYKDLDKKGAYLRAVSFVPFPAIKGMKPIKLKEFPEGDFIRFTLAHELGHLFLHMGYKINDALWESVETDRPFF